MSFFRVAFIIILCFFQSAFAGQCDALVPVGLISQVIRLGTQSSSENAQKLLDCPSEHMKLQLSASEKKNLITFYKASVLDLYPKFILNNLSFIDVDQQIDSYKKLHQTILGPSEKYSPQMTDIIAKRNALVDAKRETCFTSAVDTTDMGPIRNQLDTNWCYAAATADVVSWHAKKTLSMVDIAILYNNYSSDSSDTKRVISNRILAANPSYRKLFEKAGIILPYTEGYEFKTVQESNWKISVLTTDGALDFGDPKQALQVALDHSVCSEADLPAMPAKSGSLDEARLSAFLYKDQPDFNDSQSCENSLGNTTRLFPRLNLQQIQDIIEKSNPQQLLLKLRDANCKQKYRVPNKKVIHVLEPQFNKAFAVLNSQLDRKQPMTLTYDIKMIRTDLKGLHSSTVIGRKFNSAKNRCEYQIRNSFGTNHNSKLKETNGTYWVDEVTLKRHLKAVTGLD